MNGIFAGFAFTGSTMPASAYPDSEMCNIELNKIKPIFGGCGGSEGCSGTIKPWFTNYARIFDCQDPAVETRLSETTVCTEHKQCGAEKDSRIEYCVVERMGHCWSRGGGCCDNQCMNQSPENIDLSEKLIKFFDAVVEQPIAGHADM